MPGLEKNCRQVLRLATAMRMGVALDANANAVDHKASPLAGDYMIYSGTLDDTDLPKKNDAKVSITITGKFAADMFKYLGVAAKVDYCLTGKETEVRARNDLICIAGGEVGAECHIGIDILKGRSISGIIC